MTLKKNKYDYFQNQYYKITKKVCNIYGENNENCDDCESGKICELYSMILDEIFKLELKREKENESNRKN